MCAVLRLFYTIDGIVSRQRTVLFLHVAIVFRRRRRILIRMEFFFFPPLLFLHVAIVVRSRRRILIQYLLVMDI